MTGPQPGIVLATRSTDKAREIGEILTPILRVAIVTLAEAGIPPDPAEDNIEVFDTFLANAHAKAAYFMRLSGSPVMADDSGICVDALGGAPGVRSRRFADAAALEGVQQDRANNERLLRELNGVPQPERSAHYTCAAVLHLPDGRRFSAVGTTAGRILTEPQGVGGFGYDPLFLIPDLDRSFADIPIDQKHRRSHRGRAFRALAGAVPSGTLS